MGYGTLGVRAFRLIHPDPDRAARASGYWNSQGRDLVTGPSMYLVTMVTADMRVRAIATSVAVGPSLPDSGLLPHEAIDARLVTRRLRALRRARVDREPVLLTHSGGGLALSAAARSPEPLLELTKNDVTVTVQRIADEDVDIVAADLARRTVLVADGHHRLAAAAAHAATCAGAAATATNAECGRITALVVDSDDTPLSLQPIHRVLQRRGHATLRAPDVAAALVGTPSVPVVRTDGSHVSPDSGVHVQDVSIHDVTPHGQHHVVVLDRHGALDLTCPPRAADGLPTTAHVVEAALAALSGVDVRRLAEPDRVTAAAARRGSVGLLLPPVSRTDVLDTVAAGLLMPVKATSFRPKLPAGVLLRPLPEHW